MVNNDFVDVCVEGNPKHFPMTRTEYFHPDLRDGEYIRLFKDSELGLVFRGNELIGLWIAIQ